MSAEITPEDKDETAPRGTEARITDEDIERARRQIGIPQPPRVREHAPVPDANSMRNFAWGYGDDNPLWADQGHANRSRWRGPIAPPLYPIATGICETPPLTREQKALFRGLFAGVGKYYAGVRWIMFRPIRPADLILFEVTLDDLAVKRSSFSQGRSVIETLRTLYVNIDGEPVAVRYEDYVNAERSGSRKAGKNAKIQRERYTPDQIRDIDALYAAEVRRGVEPRYWEDVAAGDALTPVVKGPFTTTDLISMHIGWGWGGYGLGPLRFAWKLRSKMPAFYVEDEYGVPDVVQRLHWDAKRAEDLGLPAPYDYGQMRACWLTHLITNWMGDDAWLWKISNKTRAFNFQGDTHVCTGKVVDKRTEADGARVVDLEIAATNQRGEATTVGTASVILPSRDRGPVALPPAPDDLVQAGLRMIQASAERRRAG